MTADSRPDKAQSSRLILNVEDFEPARFLRTRVFRSAGYDVVEAACAREALVAATVKPLSLAIVDVNLPDSSGIELCDTLKRLRPDLPVLLISAVALSANDRRAGWEAGAHAYLGDPMPSDALLRSVSDALNGIRPESDSELWVLTDVDGCIIRTSPAGARLLAGTARGLNHRDLVVYFEKDRDAWRADMLRAARGERIWRSGSVRPKERRAVRVSVAIERSFDPSASGLLWTFHVEDTKTSSS